jgi:hypothetical protein
VNLESLVGVHQSGLNPSINSMNTNNTIAAIDHQITTLESELALLHHQYDELVSSKQEPRTRRGVVVQTNYSPCKCAVGSSRAYNVFEDVYYGLDWFQWATEMVDENSCQKSWLLENRDGVCPRCGSSTTYDEHYIVTHMDHTHVEGW